MTQTPIPRVVIGGIRSGEGKTTVALGLMAALRARGLAVQGYKVGPDYLDTGYQLLATGRPGRNLDLWMMGEDGVRRSLATHGRAAEITIIEGVMGLYDGHRDGVTPTSTAEVAKRIDAPVILVIDAAHLAASAGAIALGFRQFDPEVRIAGAILNRWNPRRSRVAVERAMAQAGVPVLGFLPAEMAVALPSRHLGLVVADEIRVETTAVLDQLGALVMEQVDLDAVVALARSAPDVASAAPGPQVAAAASRVRIAVARDEAFCFYYQENLEMLEAAGAELVDFSPLAASALPRVDGLYLGGGYPELHAEGLSRNVALRDSLRAAITGGLPTYAECGGLLYLCETLTDLAGCTWPLVGAVPRQATMHPRLQGMGYREGTVCADGLLGPAGLRLRGHEFHYSRCAAGSDARSAYLLDGQVDGYSMDNLFASYLHLHFAGCPRVVDAWMDRCRLRV